MQGSYTPGMNGGSSHGSLPDKIVYYASVFVYHPELKKDFISFSPSLQSFESKYRGLRKSLKNAHTFSQGLSEPYILRYRFEHVPSRIQRKVLRIFEHE